MTVLFMDSANGNDGATRWASYTVSSVQSAVSPSGRSAYRFLSNNASVTLTHDLSTPAASVVMASYYRTNTIAGSDGVSGTGAMQVYTDAGATLHLSLMIVSDGSMRVRLGSGNGTILATSSAGVFSINTWHHLEFRATIDNASGRAEVWVDGVQVINFTGDTRNGGTLTDIDRVRWHRVSASGGADQMDMSDLVISAQTTPNGVTTVWMSLPAGAGNTTGLSRNTGSTNWEQVDEATPDSDTSYVFSDTEGVFDLYTLSDLPSGNWDVLAVQTTFNVKTDDGGSKFVRPVLRSGGSNATGTSQSVPASYISRMEVFENNPVTAAAWTQSEVDALEVGPEVRDS